MVAEAFSIKDWSDYDDYLILFLCAFWHHTVFLIMLMHFEFLSSKKQWANFFFFSFVKEIFFFWNDIFL